MVANYSNAPTSRQVPGKRIGCEHNRSGHQSRMPETHSFAGLDGPGWPVAWLVFGGSINPAKPVASFREVCRLKGSASSVLSGKHLHSILRTRGIKHRPRWGNLQ